MTTSIEMKPYENFQKIFMKSQLCSEPNLPPAGLSLAGQTAIVTGANSGLGLTCATKLLDLGLTRLIMPVRSAERGEAAASKLREKHQSATVDVWPLDMVSYDSVQAFVARCADLPRIDFFIHGAALFAESFRLSPAGHEESIQVNYLSTALLAILLLPVLRDRAAPGKPGRLTLVNSAAANTAKFAQQGKTPLLDAFNDPKSFDDAMERYVTTKLLFHHFLVKLAEHVKPEDVVVNIIDPGLCKGSNLHRHLSGPARAAMYVGKAVIGRTLETGASTYIDGAVLKGPETHGCFIMDWAIAPFVPTVYTPEGKVVTETLWEETLQELDFAGVRSILGSMQSGAR
ncbi:short-chain dehydrogenase [Colletotrichum plurivorum]|uniref:Short-chain dehydrogenase n=1 Tax=Colletotrichum plurivorum TaxID=2175906 RepID=A0A8H6JN03_9PEZI|nr:short-chain dehydrogenase [Colletotrichum plurivorum]